MSRSGPLVTALAGALLLGCLGVAPAAAATPDEATEEEQGPPQEAVAVPYLGETDIRPGAPWTVVACPDPPDGLRVSCAPDRVTLVADGYDPEWGERTLAVGIAGQLGSLEVRYRVILAPPEPPAADPVLWGVPVASGSQVLVPVAAFAATCTLCTPGVALLDVAGVEPVSAAIAASTGTHVAVRVTPGFVGDLVVGVRLVDDAGQPLEFEIALRVGPAPAQPFGGLHVLVPLADDGTATVDLGALAWPEPLENTSFDCSAALTGSVACADGIAVYTAPPADEDTDAPGGDQFLVRLVAPGGRLALASVTVLPTGVAETTLAPAIGRDSAALPLVLPPPPGEGDSAEVSALEALAELLEPEGLAG